MKELRHARLAVSAYFFLVGAVTATWTARIPAVKDQVDLTDGTLSIALLAVAAGAVVAMRIAGGLVDRVGAVRVVLPSGVLLCAALVGPALSRDLATLCAALFAFGAAHGLVDVAMNVNASHLQHAYGRPIMTSIHAAFSIGGLCGAVLGGLTAHAGISPTATFTALAVPGAAVMALSARRLFPDAVADAAAVPVSKPVSDPTPAPAQDTAAAPKHAESTPGAAVAEEGPRAEETPKAEEGTEPEGAPELEGASDAESAPEAEKGPDHEDGLASDESRASETLESEDAPASETSKSEDDPASEVVPAPKRRWDGRVALLGLLALFCLLGEGAMADWSAVYLHDDLDTSHSLAAYGYAAFSIAMAVGRLVGDRVTARMGAAALVRLCGLLAGCGLAAGLAAEQAWAAIAGFGLFGLGLSAIVPTIFTAVASRGGNNTGRDLARVSSIGYLGFLVGPAAIGAVAHLTGLRTALAVPAALAVLIALAAPALNVSPRRNRHDSDLASGDTVPAHVDAGPTDDTDSLDGTDDGDGNSSDAGGGDGTDAVDDAQDPAGADGTDDAAGTDDPGTRVGVGVDTADRADAVPASRPVAGVAAAG